MKIYRTKSNWMDEERLHQPSMDVIESERGWVRTGLLDMHGNELMSSVGPEPVGFVTTFQRADEIPHTQKPKKGRR